MCTVGPSWTTGMITLSRRTWRTQQTISPGSYPVTILMKQSSSQTQVKVSRNTWIEQNRDGIYESKKQIN